VHYLRLRGVKISPIAGVEAAERWNVEAFGIAMVTQWTQHVYYICPIKRIIDSSFELELEPRTANRNGIKTRVINAISMFAIFLRANINKSKVTTSRNILLLFIYKKLLQFSQTSSALISCRVSAYLSTSITFLSRLSCIGGIRSV